MKRETGKVMAEPWVSMHTLCKVTQGCQILVESSEERKRRSRVIGMKGLGCDYVSMERWPLSV